MAKRETILAELDARQIGYDEKMSNKELSDLLAKADAKAKEKPVDNSMVGVKCGLSTIQDHELRIRRLERALEA